MDELDVAYEKFSYSTLFIEVLLIFRINLMRQPEENQFGKNFLIFSLEQM